MKQPQSRGRRPLRRDSLVASARREMRQAPVLTRHFLFSGIYLVWWITLLSFVLSGAYRSFIRPSFVIFLWGALAILLVFIVAGLREMGGLKLRFADLVRGGIILLPLVSLWIAYGKPLGSHAYRKKAVTAQQPATAPASAGEPKTAGRTPPLLTQAHINKEPAPLQVTILDLIRRPREYQGKWIVTEGMALQQETVSQDASFKAQARLPDSFILFRFMIVCCVADSSPLGVIVEYANVDSILDNGWYRVVGRFSLNKEKMGVISQAVVSNLATPPDPPYLFENMGLQPFTSK